MPKTTPRRESVPADPLVQTFTLLLSGTRIYARNEDRKLIDLGEAKQDGKEGKSAWSYLLDVDAIAGNGFKTPAALLKDLGGKIDFAYLDSQFTSLPNHSPTDEGIDVRHAATLEVQYDEVPDSGL
ncbi:MAG: hypothetical protein ACRYHA_25160 [Janthinobacterium lividum]